MFLKKKRLAIFFVLTVSIIIILFIAKLEPPLMIYIYENKNDELLLVKEITYEQKDYNDLEYVITIIGDVEKNEDRVITSPYNYLIEAINRNSPNLLIYLWFEPNEKKIYLINNTEQIYTDEDGQPLRYPNWRSKTEAPLEFLEFLSQ